MTQAKEQELPIILNKTYYKNMESIKRPMLARLKQLNKTFVGIGNLKNDGLNLNLD